MKQHWQGCLACLFGIWAGFSQQPSDSIPMQELEEVVVTDTRIPLKREQSGKTVIQLNREDLDRYQGQSFPDVLNQLSGFEISGSRGRPGEVLGVFARGGRGRQVLVLVDGLRVTDASSAAREFDLRLLPLSSIESVEIVKGATSVLYGANAATAVINIKTRAPADRPLALRVEGSTGTQNTVEESDWDLGTFNQYVQLSGRQQGWEYKGSFANTFANGLSSLAAGSEPDPYSNWSVDLQAGRELSGHSRIGIFANTSRMKAAYDDSFNGVDAPFQFNTIQERIGFSWAWKDSIQELKALGSYADFRSENLSDFPGQFEGRSWTGDVTYRRTLLPGLYALGGLNVFQDKVDLERTEEFTVVDPYLNLVWTADFGLNLNTGVRLNMHSTYGNNAVYQVNPSYAYRFRQGYLKVMGSWATAYITPSLAQLYGAFGANPDLQPERNTTLEAGLEVNLSSGLRISLLHFDRREDDTVLFNNTDFLFFNSEGENRVRGVEGEVRWIWHPSSELALNYTFTEPQGEGAIRIPKHKLNVSARSQLGKKLQATARYSFTGRRTDTDFTTFTPVELEGFSLIDLRLDYKLIPQRLSAFISLDNVFNTAYTEVLGFTTPGRNVMLGWSLKL